MCSYLFSICKYIYTLGWPPSFLLEVILLITYLLLVMDILLLFWMGQHAQMWHTYLSFLRRSLSSVQGPSTHTAQTFPGLPQPLVFCPEKMVGSWSSPMERDWFSIFLVVITTAYHSAFLWVNLVFESQAKTSTTVECPLACLGYGVTKSEELQKKRKFIVLQRQWLAWCYGSRPTKMAHLGSIASVEPTLSQKGELRVQCLHRT